MAVVAVLMAASLAPGLPRMAAPAGLTWKVLKAARYRDCQNGAGDYPQNWYDQGIAVDPNNPDRVFFDTFDVWFATRTGTVWNDTTCGYSYPGSAGPVHVDQHALAFLPGSPAFWQLGMMAASTEPQTRTLQRRQWIRPGLTWIQVSTRSSFTPATSAATLLMLLLRRQVAGRKTTARRQ